MYIDFEDHRPEIPRVPQVASLRTGAGLSIVLHALGLALLVFGPGMIAAASSTSPATVIPPPDQIRYVSIAPRLDRLAPPVRPAPASDLDRRSATKQRAPVPTNTQPLSRGNSPERIEGNNGERAIAAEPPAAAAPPSTPPTTAANPPTTVVPDGVIPVPAPAASSAPGLSASLRNLKEFSEAFSCAPGTPMNPATSCSVW